MAAFRKNKVAAARWVLVAACMAATITTASAEDDIPKEMQNFCSATGLTDSCDGEKMSEAKEHIKSVFDKAAAELEITIRNTSMYKALERDDMTKKALDVCERVLKDSIDDLWYSFDHIQSFKIGEVSKVLDEVKIWMSGAITSKDTCYDAFAKTRGKSRRVVRQMLKAPGALLDKALALVYEFQKSFQTISKDLEGIIDKINGDTDGSEVPDFVSEHARKMIEGQPRVLLPPNKVVAQDGSGDFTTITEAIASVPPKSKIPYVILVKAGKYEEYVLIPKGTDEVVLVGEGPTNTIISGKKSWGTHIQTIDQATLIVEAQGFMAKDIGIENTANPIEEQAVAVRTSGDLGVFFQVHMSSYQDTLYAHKNRQLFRDCRISGTIDFIFGNSIAVLQKCDLVVRTPLRDQQCMVTAQGRNHENTTGITIIQACNIVTEETFEKQPPFPSFLGRPWKDMSRTIIIETVIGGFISPAGWALWGGGRHEADEDLFIVEYKNTGDGAGIGARIQWNGIQNKGTEKKIDSDDAVQPWLPGVHFVLDEWIKNSGVPYSPGLMNTVA